MQDVFGQGRVAYQAFGDAEQARPFLVIKGFQSLALTSGTSGDAACVVKQGFG